MIRLEKVSYNLMSLSKLEYSGFASNKTFSGTARLAVVFSRRFSSEKCPTLTVASF